MRYRLRTLFIVAIAAACFIVGAFVLWKEIELRRRIARETPLQNNVRIGRDIAPAGP
jgi:hypothetical protein